MVNPILQEKNPEFAEHLQSLLDNFERNYDLDNNVAEQANFAEGAIEFSRIMARMSLSGRIQVSLGDNGVHQLVISVTPKNLS